MKIDLKGFQDLHIKTELVRKSSSTGCVLHVTTPCILYGQRVKDFVSDGKTTMPDYYTIPTEIWQW